MAYICLCACTCLFLYTFSKATIPSKKKDVIPLYNLGYLDQLNKLVKKKKIQPPAVHAFGEFLLNKDDQS